MADIAKVLSRLKKKYPSATISLASSNPFELLVATILSAQCTDARVNRITPVLFKKYRKVGDYARADRKTFEKEVRSTGFYRNKAKNIIASAQTVLRDFGGRLPQTMEELLTLPGVARKTANVVLFSAFGKNVGIAVDTHVARISQRLGLAKNSDPVKIEKDLMGLLSRKEWGLFSLRLIRHGRQTCQAKSPRCSACVLKDICPSKKILYPHL